MDESFGKKIKQAREAQNISQIELAHKANLSLNLIYRVERDNHVPTLGYLYPLCESLNLDIHEIFKSINYLKLPYERKK